MGSMEKKRRRPEKSVSSAHCPTLEFRNTAEKKKMTHWLEAFVHVGEKVSEKTDNINTNERVLYQ
jgi:hypothetical protein